MAQKGVKHDNMARLSLLRFLDSLGTVMEHTKSLDESSLHNAADKTSQGALDLRLDLKNFGPVVKGTVQIRPLTILVGPNNSGKSYVAVLLHSILSACTPYTFEVIGGADKEKFGMQLPQIANGATQKPISRKMLKKIHDLHTQRFGRKIGEKLLYNFKSDLSELIQNGRDSASITISSDNTIDVTIKNEIIVAKSKSKSKKLKIELVEDANKSPIQETETEIVLSITPNMKDLMSYFISMYVGLDVLPQLPQSHYLPANRSGVLQAYKTLAANLASAIPNMGPFSTHMLTELAPKAADTFSAHVLTGTITDFISKLITIPDKKGELADVARQMENDLFHGSIDLPHSGNKISEITYSTKKYKIPLNRTSSSISEVAPLSLYLKYMVKPGDLLIIEEPEAHQHPANQAKMATSIVRMIRAGLNVLITTHSPLLVEKLGHYVVAGMRDTKTRASHKPYDKDYLLPDEVSPYVFSNSGDGYFIREIDKDDKYGISQEEFIPILDELNNDAIMLQEKLCKKYADV